MVEVLRWHDMSALVELCDSQLSGTKTSVLEYGLMLSVKYSMQHAVNLAQFCQRSQMYCQVRPCSSFQANIIMSAILTGHCPVHLFYLFFWPSF